jgi:xanthine dehydrogenase accessory factor
VKLALLEQLRAARAAHRPVALATWIQTGAQALLGEPELAGARSTPHAALAEAAAQALATDQAALIDSDAGPIFVEPHNPPLRLIIVGAVHIAHALATMATVAGFAVTVVDPRTAFATAARFPGMHLVTRWPAEALADLGLDARAAVVTLTHDAKLDDPALASALASPAFYVGCLGSRKTHAARLGRLAERGVGADALARLHGPVGLTLGARSPAEIAVSILAQIIAVLRAPRPA